MTVSRSASPTASRRRPDPGDGPDVPDYAVERAKLMATLFLQDLEPFHLALGGEEDGPTFFAGFRNAAGGLNLCPVEVLPTERPVGATYRLPLGDYERLIQSDPPGLLLVADAKRSELFYAWPSEGAATPRAGDRGCDLPVFPADKTAKQEIAARLTRPPVRTAVGRNGSAVPAAAA